MAFQAVGGESDDEEEGHEKGGNGKKAGWGRRWLRRVLRLGL